MITGASGGSILAALLAIKTEEELLREVLTEDFSTDFKVRGGNGGSGVWINHLCADRMADQPTTHIYTCRAHRAAGR